MPDDVIHGEVLPDGTLALTTSAVSPTNHDSAEDFLARLLKTTGGAGTRWKVTERTEKPLGHTHRHGDRQHEH